MFPFVFQARVDSVSPSKSSSQVNAKLKDSSPKKSPIKTSSKLAQMKRRQEEEDEEKKKDRVEKKISPKKEPISPNSSERAATPKTGSASMGTSKSRTISTPKGGAPSKTSPTKPEVSFCIIPWKLFQPFISSLIFLINVCYL